MDTLNYCYYIPFSVTGGREALKEIDNGKFDVIITGTNLSDMDSLSLMKEVKLKHPDIPIIVTDVESALESEQQKIRGFQIDGYLKKPFETADIINLLNRLSPIKTDN